MKNKLLVLRAIHFAKELNTSPGHADKQSLQKLFGITEASMQNWQFTEVIYSKQDIETLAFALT